MASFGGS
jgi:hypothetical protein